MYIFQLIGSLFGLGFSYCFHNYGLNSSRKTKKKVSCIFGISLGLVIGFILLSLISNIDYVIKLVILFVFSIILMIYSCFYLKYI